MFHNVHKIAVVKGRVNLFQLTLKVRPSTGHPLLHEWDHGFLSVWLFADSDDDAVDRAFTIVDQLPYELAKDDVASVREWTNDSTFPQEWHPHAAIARGTGLALRLDCIAAGQGDTVAFDQLETP